MDFNKISDGVIEIDKGTNYDNLLEYYKAITFKLIFTCESTMYKISENEKLKANLLNSTTNFLISEYMKQLFMGLMHAEFDNDIDNQITEIMQITSNSRDMVIKKCFSLIDNFYKYLERPRLKASDYDKYKNSFISVFNDFIQYNTEEILNIFADDKFKLETTFELSLDNF
tara:strand:+ start:4036 stop:4548 length:513 start_codon:yes stop_codon:yes gene_type:complete